MPPGAGSVCRWPRALLRRRERAKGSHRRTGLRVSAGVRLARCVGKSSLPNRLAGRSTNDTWLTDIPLGRTRDAPRETIQIDGIPLRIIVNTAGLRDSGGPVERRIGIEPDLEGGLPI